MKQVAALTYNVGGVTFVSRATRGPCLGHIINLGSWQGLASAHGDHHGDKLRPLRPAGAGGGRATSVTPRIRFASMPAYPAICQNPKTIHTKPFLEPRRKSCRAPAAAICSSHPGHCSALRCPHGNPRARDVQARHLLPARRPAAIARRDQRGANPSSSKSRQHGGG